MNPVSRGFRGIYAAAPGQTARVTRCVSYSVRALISRQSRETRFAQTTRFVAAASADLATEASLSSRGLSSGRKRLGVASYEGAEYILTVREAGEHFCELCEQKFYIRRPNKSERFCRAGMDFTSLLC